MTLRAALGASIAAGPVAAVLLAVGVVAPTAGPAAAEPGVSPTPVVVPVVSAVVPHDPAAYSEGLEFDGPELFEATGEVGKSQLRQVDPATGRVLRAADLPHGWFGEGIAVLDDRIWQLTYTEGVAIEWDRATFTPRRLAAYTGQGWGLCRDGDRLVRSDGSDRLSFHDVDTFALLGSVAVTRDGEPVTGLNELDCTDGRVWAAQWPRDAFVDIDPITGVVARTLDVSGLFTDPGRDRSRQVVSGIAHIGGDEYLISGKEWPSSFRVRIPATS